MSFKLGYSCPLFVTNCVYVRCLNSCYISISDVPVDVVAGDWVAVIYDHWWPRTVDSVSADDEISVSFYMKPVAKNKFIWHQDSNVKCIDTDVVPMRFWQSLKRSQYQNLIATSPSWHIIQVG